MSRFLSLLLLSLAGCSPTPEPDAVVVGANEPDLQRGEILSLACQACHTLEEGEGALLGPNLHGVFGRVSATTGDFEYSSALRAAEIVWTPEALDEWLSNPNAFLPGNNMAFAGYSRAQDRRDLIAFLLHKTGVAPD